MRSEKKTQTNAKPIGKGGAGPGRPKGIPNKFTMNIKAAFEEAFARRGGADALLAWADDEPTEFYKLAAKLIPVQVQGELNVSAIADRMARVKETGVAVTLLGAMKSGGEEE